MNHEKRFNSKIYKMYLDYFNNFITMQSWQEYYRITASTAMRIYLINKAYENDMPQKTTEN